MSDTFSIVISLVALGVSVTTAWLTFFRAGQLRMTQPTVVYFGPDRSTHRKVFLRTLLYSSARRGQTIESLYVNVQRGESKQNFPIWVYGERDSLVRGSGLFVPYEGIATNHHFMLPEDGSDFTFLPGDYTIRVFVKRVSATASEELASIRVHLSDAHARELLEKNTGIYFDWGPDRQAYHPHIDRRPPQAIPKELLELAGQ